jgi:hypothetical protein
MLQRRVRSSRAKSGNFFVQNAGNSVNFEAPRMSDSGNFGNSDLMRVQQFCAALISKNSAKAGRIRHSTPAVSAVMR